jgi:homoserine dehydrogenase
MDGMKDRIGIGLVGLGTVGGAFARLIEVNGELLQARYGVQVELVRVGVARLDKPRRVAADLLVQGYEKVLADPRVDVVVELMGGVEHPRALITAAMRAGKHVITGNKALIAEHGEELLALAHRHGVQLRFEASVCGGIPVIKVIRESLSANRIHSLTGIVNGTTNYILTRMTSSGASFADALAEAQERGFAEADPTLDVDGTDAVQKMAILCSLAFGGWCSYRDAMWQGIESVTAKDVEFAALSGFVFKLVAMGRVIDGLTSVAVFPALVATGHPLAAVRDEFNAVMIDSDFQGPSVLVGKGAGDRPSASSVAADLADLLAGSAAAGPAPQRSTLFPSEQLTFRYYFHFVTENRPGIWAQVTGLLAEHEINIESVHQKWEHPEQPSDLYVLVDPVAEHRARAALAAISAAPGIFPESRFYRILPDEQE